MDEIYKENILDHYRAPRHHGVLSPCTVMKEGNNPSCGDAQTMYAMLDGKKITDASFVGEGCAISQAATSMLLEKVIGMNTEEVIRFGPDDMREMLGVPIGESREKCMMLGLDTLKQSINNHA